MDDKNIVIDVSDVTVRFNRASQQVNNLKEYVIKMVKKELWILKKIKLILLLVSNLQANLQL